MNADVVVVVSAKSAVMALTTEQIAQIFLGKVSRFPSGGVAVPVDQVEGAALRNEFYSKVTGKDAAQLKAYWSRIVFTGKGQPPRELSSNAEVRKLVAQNPDVIGYIDRSAVDTSVRVVLAP